MNVMLQSFEVKYGYLDYLVKKIEIEIEINIYVSHSNQLSNYLQFINVYILNSF